MMMSLDRNEGEEGEAEKGAEDRRSEERFPSLQPFNRRPLADRPVFGAGSLRYATRR
jgi:hypothetical protein